MDAFETIIYEKQGEIAWLTLNRPEVLNAVNLQMRDELWTVLEAVRDDPDLRALIIKGAGRAFSAGADITEFGTAPSFVEARRARHERDLWGLMLSLPLPLVAAIHGFALGAGCEMSMCCDFRIASEDAHFGLPEVSLGYIPSAGGTQLLPRTISPGVAMGLILSGDAIDAREAWRLGLVQRVVPRRRLYPEAESLAGSLAARPSEAQRRAKEAVLQGLDMPLDQGLALEERLASLALASGEAKAGLVAWRSTSL
jgi:enoyl-CoA hydratase/carnithine racemase